jgi:dihydroflavonol-4-reductase
MDSAQVLVTGGTGFIGRHVVKLLLERGNRVRLLVRDLEKARSLFHEDAELIQGDIRDSRTVLRAIRGAESVYHAAGLYAFGLGHKKALYETNVSGTENVLRAASEAGARRVVHVSSAGVLAAAGRKMNEKDFPAAPRRGCFYKGSKWEAEQAALAWARRGLPVVITSPTCPIGAGDEGPTPTGRIILDFLRRKFPFSTRTGLNFIDVHDAAAGILAAHDRGAAGERYILGHHNVWLTEFLSLLGKETRLPAPKTELPWWVIALAGASCEAGASLGLPAARQLCWETAVQSGRIQFFDISHTRAKLGWSPHHPLQESVRRAVAFFEGRLKRPECALESTATPADVC